jgi:HD-GYP domain-containing protein (c-di-GMP phosphodiesterase class II)
MTRSDDRRAQALGRDLVLRLAALGKSVGLYDANNAALRAVSEALRETVVDALDGGVELEITIQADSIFVAGLRVRESLVASTLYQRIIDLFRRCEICRVSIDESVTARELEEFVRLLIDVSSGRRRAADLETELSIRSLDNIAIGLGTVEALEDESLDAELIAKRVYLRSIGVVKTMFHDVQARDRVAARRVKRAVQEMIESIDSSPGYLMNLASLKNYDEYTFNHSVNVSVFAVALGRQVGLSRRLLYAVGQAGMLHDLGKLCIPKAVLNKPGALSAEERSVIEEHPVDGFLSIASHMGVSEETVPVAMAAYEHHVREGQVGYPSCAVHRPKGLLSKIVSIVDCYDAMTSARVYRGYPISPPDTLAMMYEEGRGAYDPALLRYFMNLMGCYPVGTVVLLADGSLAIVVAPAIDQALMRLPVVKVISDDAGHLVPPRVVDLAATAKDDEPLSVSQVLNAAEQCIDASKYLL